MRWRGKGAGGDRARLLVVSHDAALAGAQLIVLENIRHWTRRGVDCRALLLGSGALEGAFIDACPTACVDDLRGVTRGKGVAAALDDLASRGWTPDAAFCNTAASGDAAKALGARGVPVVSAVYELPTSIDDSLGSVTISLISHAGTEPRRVLSGDAVVTHSEVRITMRPIRAVNTARNATRAPMLVPSIR